MRKITLFSAMLLSQMLFGQNVADFSNQSDVKSTNEYDYESTNLRSNPIFFEDFEAGIPSNWNRYVGLMDDILNGGSFQGNDNGGIPWQLLNPTSPQFLPGDGLNTRHITTSTLTGTVKNWLVTSYNVVPTNSYLSFDASFNKHQSAEVASLNGTDDIFAVLYQIDNGNWQVLAKWDNQGSERVLNSIDQFPQTITLPIEISQSSNLRIAFYAESTIANTDNTIHVDNIGVWTSSGCPAPSNIAVSEKNKNSATICWDLPEGITSCDLQYKKVNDFSTWNNVYSINASSYTLTNLESETHYRVRLCSKNAQGEGCWSESIVFRTSLDHTNYSIPFTEAFSSTSIPNNWKVLIDPAEYVLSFGGHHPKQPKPGTSTYGLWDIYGGYYSFGAYHAKVYCYNSRTSWFTTPNIELSTASNPDNLYLVFDVAKTAEISNAAPPANLPDNDDEFKVLISTDGGETWLPENCITWKKSGGDHSFNEISNTGITVRIPLNNYANGTVMIAFYCGSKTGGSGFELHIDNIFVGEASHIFIADGDWNNSQNWLNQSIPGENDGALLKANATIPANYTANVNSVATMNGSLTIADGGQLIHGNEGLQATMLKDIQGYGNNNNTNGWYFISHPMTTDLQTSDITGLMDYDYDLYAFNTNETLEWRNFKDSDNHLDALNATEGYLYGSISNTQLAFNGTLNPANEAMTITDLKYNANSRKKGFNLVGNPFACNASVNKLVYVMNDDHTNIITPPSGYVVAPNEAVFVQVTSNDRTVTFTPSNIGGRNDNGICIEVKKADTRSGSFGILDRARISFRNQGNLTKYTLNDNSTKIYIPVGDEDFAIVEAQPEGEMPLNFKAESNGNYVLYVYSDDIELGYLHLIDNLTGADIDLLKSPNYSFEANTADYASRFKLVYSDKNEVEAVDESFAYFDGSVLRIANEGNATMQIVDALGHVISSEAIQGSYDKDVNLSAGIYILRIIGNDNVKTQKIIVK